jgi:hypothetical protein
MPPATSATSPPTAEAEPQTVHARRALRRGDVEAAASAPVALLQGYDSVIGAGLATAIQGPPPTKVDARSDVTYTGCESIETLSRALRVDQSLSVGFGPFGGVDQKMTFIRNLDVTTTSVSIVVYARHVTGKHVLTDYSLKPNIPPPAGDEELKRFFYSYGDSFLTSVTNGGEYYAVYTFYTQTKTEQTSLVGELKAKGIWSTGNVDASLQLKLDQFIKSTTTRYRLEQTVTGIANPKLPDAAQIITYAIDFPSKPIDTPVVIGFETLGYERVPGIQNFQPIVKNRTYFTGFLRDDAGLTKDLVKLQQLVNQADWIKSVYRFYGDYADEELNRVTALARADIDAIDDQIEAFEADPIQTFTRPNLQALGFGTPVLAYDVSKSQSWGGGGGGPFDDVDPRTALQKKTWLSAIQLRTGAVVDRLIAVYENEDHERRLIEHGGSGGTLSSELKFLEGEFVVNVTGRAAKLVDRLNFRTNKGHEVGGGGGGGTPFVWDIHKGMFVLGFAGRSGTRLDQLAIVYAGFKPATWTPF